jgi:hypothetical protein
VISITGLDKGAVLAALWNNAALPPAHVFPNPRTRPMTAGEGHSALMVAIAARATGFDYHEGRILKVNLASDEIDPWGYDRDNGNGLAERVIEHLRSTGSVDPLASSA